MPEYLVRSGRLCAVVQAEGAVEAIHSGIANWKQDDDGVLELGASIEVTALDDCDAAKVYLNAPATLALLGFEEPESCGLAVSPTTVS
jgi:hypothetical protein